MTEHDRKNFLLLVQLVEVLVVEVLCLRLVLDKSAVAQWKTTVEQLKADSTLNQGLHDFFRTLYVRIADTRSAEQAIEELLRDIPTTLKAN